GGPPSPGRRPRRAGAGGGLGRPHARGRELELAARRPLRRRGEQHPEAVAAPPLPREARLEGAHGGARRRHGGGGRQDDRAHRAREREAGLLGPLAHRSSPRGLHARPRAGARIGSGRRRALRRRDGRAARRAARRSRAHPHRDPPGHHAPRARAGRGAPERAPLARPRGAARDAPRSRAGAPARAARPPARARARAPPGAGGARRGRRARAGRRRPRAPQLPPRLRPHLRALLQPRRPRRVRRHDRHDAAAPLQVPPRRRARRGARPPRQRGGDAAACRGPHRGRGEAVARRPRGRGRRARAARRHAPPAGRAVLRRLARGLCGRQPRLHGAGRQPAHDRVHAPLAPRDGGRLREGLRQPRDGGRGRAAPGGAPMSRPLALETERRLRQSSFPGVRVSAASLSGASRERLRLWDLSPQQMRALEESGQARRTLTIYSPIVGVVIEKLAVVGQRVEPGMTLYRIADLSTIWVYGDVYEYELPFVKVGQEASLALTAYPEQRFTARVAYVAPMLDAKTRTAKVRFELPNSPDQLLRPEMYGTVELRVPLGER